MQRHRSKSCGMLAVETGVWQNPERHCFNKVGTDSTCMCPHTKSAKQKSPRPQHLLLTLQGQVSTEKSSIHILQEHQALLGGDTQQMVEPVIREARVCEAEKADAVLQFSSQSSSVDGHTEGGPRQPEASLGLPRGLPQRPTSPVPPTNVVSIWFNPARSSQTHVSLPTLSGQFCKDCVVQSRENWTTHIKLLFPQPGGP